MSDEDEVPPLEDMSDLLKQVNSIKSQKPSDVKSASVNHKQDPSSNPSSINHPGNPVCSPDPAAANNNSAPIKKSPAKPSAESNKTKADTGHTFGGMKKGFLFGGSTKTKSKPVTKPATNQKPVSKCNEDIPLLKPRDADAKEKQYEIPEVQQAMNASKSFLQNKDWVTEDLLSKVQNNESLLRGMSNPHFMQAITEFQTNPQAAMMKYQANPEIRKFLTDFCGILGEHFDTLGGDQTTAPVPPQPRTGGILTPGDAGQGADLSVRSSTDPNQMTGEDERRMQKILTDPDIRQILMDPQIQNLMSSLRTDPELAQRLLHQSDKKLQMKIQKLVSVGLLQFQR